MSKPRGRVAVITDAASNTGHCDKLRELCLDLGVSCDVHVTSDHTGPQDTRKLLAEYEGGCHWVDVNSDVCGYGGLNVCGHAYFGAHGKYKDYVYRKC